MPRHELKAAKAMHFVKRLINESASLVFQGVDPRLDGRYLCLPARLKWHFHLAFKWYPDESIGFPDGGILGHKLREQREYVLKLVDSHSVI